jgi:hypothetical protein
MKKIFALVLSLGLIAPFAALPAAACAACYNVNAGSKMGNAANWGVIAMAIIMILMLGALFAAGCYFNWRAKNPLPDYNELLSEDNNEFLSENEETLPPDALPDAS